jgi:hypothetical protein
MASIAFEAVAHNGTISLPAQYAELFPENARLLVHLEPLAQHEVTSAPFKALRISTKGFIFNREEANAR